MFVLGMTALCTITGGLKAAMLTETIQSAIMVIGGLTLMIFSFKEIGGITNLHRKYMDSSHLNASAANYKCALPKENSFQMLRDLSDKEMPWLGFLLGYFIFLTCFYYFNSLMNLFYLFFDSKVRRHLRFGIGVRIK